MNSTKFLRYLLVNIFANINILRYNAIYKYITQKVKNKDRLKENKKLHQEISEKVRCFKCYLLELYMRFSWK